MNSGILSVASYQGASSNSHPYFPALWHFISGLLSIILYVSPAFRTVERLWVVPALFLWTVSAHTCLWSQWKVIIWLSWERSETQCQVRCYYHTGSESSSIFSHRIWINCTTLLLPSPKPTRLSCPHSSVGSEQLRCERDGEKDVAWEVAGFIVVQRFFWGLANQSVPGSMLG